MPPTLPWVASSAFGGVRAAQKLNGLPVVVRERLHMPGAPFEHRRADRRPQVVRSVLRELGAPLPEAAVETRR